MNRFDTVIVSDLHLGARNARIDCVQGFLDWVRTGRIILAGDVFDKPTVAHLDSPCLGLIDRLRAFANRNELVWLQGNHDPVDAQLPGWNMTSRQEIRIDVGGRPYCVCHGHKWDKSLDLPNWIINGADAIYHFAQWLDPTHRLARKLKRSCKQFCRSIRMLREQAVSVARQRDLAGIILGHSHVAHNIRIDGVHYLNAGCWTETPSGFVGIRDGQARAYYWNARTREAEPLPAVIENQTPLSMDPIDQPWIEEAA